MAALPTTLATDACQLYRPSASFSTASSSSSKAPYVTHLSSGGSNVGSPLVCFTDDGVLRLLDRQRLALTANPCAWEAGGVCTSLCSVPSSASSSSSSAGGSSTAWFAAGRNGMISYFEAGRGRPADERLCLRGPSGAPYLSVAASSDGHSVAAGTELRGVDATVDIWDTRNPSRPALTYTESHSDDVTWLSYHPSIPNALLSASSDGLISIIDTHQTDEDDAVLGVTNTGASVARAGWGGFGRAPYPYIRPDPPHVRSKEEASQLAGMESSDTTTPRLGCFWSASDMQTLGVWEADDFDELMPPFDIREAEPKSVRNRWKSDYLIDAWASGSCGSSNESEGLMLHCGDQRGNVAIIGGPHQTKAQGASSPLQWQMYGLLAAAPSPTDQTRNNTFGPAVYGHTDIVRAICSADNATFFTGGEDGVVCVWKTSDEQQRINPDNFDFEGYQRDAVEDGEQDEERDNTFGRTTAKGASSSRHAGGGGLFSSSSLGQGGKVRSEERAKPSYRPY